ncbi:hypothetical protein B0H19DRAFT_949484 [Mycena capillaripes]|nr:hypothetical protein B0H19DRAFT_949484 [Mycena capillaripes]
MVALTRAEGLWFQDCGLVIQAETTIFRVSREFLAMQSPIFRDMLSLPPPEDADMMDGCPFVFLPDKAEDVAVFLKALLHFDFFEPSPAPTTLSILSSILRMSHKYEVRALWRRAIVHLSSLHPTTLHEYENLRLSWFDLLTDADYLEIILLAREFHLDWILPMAFYRACEFTSDATTLESPLELDDKVRFMSGSRYLETESMCDLLCFLWSPLKIDGCDSPHKCLSSRINVRRTVECGRERLALDLWKQEHWATLDVCNVCLSSMKIVQQEAMQSLWDTLPEVYGLPGWSELGDVKVEVLK